MPAECCSDVFQSLEPRSLLAGTSKVLDWLRGLLENNGRKFKGHIFEVSRSVFALPLTPELIKVCRNIDQMSRNPLIDVERILKITHLDEFDR